MNIVPRYLSVCSGIEAATCAWHPLGWTPVAFAEIEKFPSAVLAHHYPSVPNWGDMTQFQEWPDATIDLLVGGTPCQSFSVAGLRQGLADPRGNLALTYLALADKYRPEWLVWENVPGVLSSGGGRDFGAFLGGLGELGYGWAYRVLDAQYFGLAQRRKRVFVVASARGWQRAAAVLFDAASLRGDSAPRREAGENATYNTAPSLTASGRGTERTGESRGQDCVIPEIVNALTERADRGGGNSEGQRLIPALGALGDIPEIASAFGGNRTSGPIDVATACQAHGGPHGRQDFASETFVVHALRADGFDASEDGTGRGTPLTVGWLPQRGRVHDAAGVAPTLASEEGRGHDVPTIAIQNATRGQDQTLDQASQHAVAFDARQSDVIQYGEKTGPLDTDGHSVGVHHAMQVRRLTPRECERLQGFPDDYTLTRYRGKAAADGPRYKALGNSMAVPVMRWIGQRLQRVSEVTT